MVATTGFTEEGTSKTMQAGGMTIHYHEVGQGDPVVFLHSYGPGTTAWITFYKTLDVLSKHFRCLLLDLPNFGRTGPVVYHEPVHDLHARTALALMDALGIEKAHLVGNSQGGQAAMVFAYAYPDRIGKLVTGACHIATGGDRFRASCHADVPTAWVHKAFHAWVDDREGPERSKEVEYLL